MDLDFCSLTGLLQTDAERAARLRQVQDELQIEDEHLGGGRYNDLLELQRKNKKGSNVPRSDSDPVAAAGLQHAQVLLPLMACSMPALRQAVCSRADAVLLSYSAHHRLVKGPLPGHHRD